MRTTDDAETDRGSPNDNRRAKYLVAHLAGDGRANSKTVTLGDLVVAAFDEAALVSADPREVSRLAARRVRRVLRHGRSV